MSLEQFYVALLLHEVFLIYELVINGLWGILIRFHSFVIRTSETRVMNIKVAYYSCI